MGGEDGTISLHDEDYSGAQLRDLLENQSFHHVPDVSLCFNSCFGIHFVSSIISIDVAKIVENIGSFASLNETSKMYYDKAMKLLETKRSRELTECDQRGFDKANFELFHFLLNGNRALCQNRSILSFSNKTSRVFYLWPLSLDDMPLKGNITLWENVGKYFDCSKMQSTIRRETQRKKWYESSDVSIFHAKVPEVSDLEKADAITEELNSVKNCVKIFLFDASYGDSCLIRLDDFTVLIDGGIATDPPVFWPYVKRLKLQINTLFVTHGDRDHVYGILPLLHYYKKVKPSSIKIDSVCTLSLPPKVKTKTRTWHDSNKIVKLCEDLDINLYRLKAQDKQSPIWLPPDRLLHQSMYTSVSRYLGFYNHVKLQVIWPDTAHIELARDELKKQFNKSSFKNPHINKCSLVIYVSVYVKGGMYDYCLLVIVMRLIF